MLFSDTQSSFTWKTQVALQEDSFKYHVAFIMFISSINSSQLNVPCVRTAVLSLFQVTITHILPRTTLRQPAAWHEILPSINDLLYILYYYFLHYIFVMLALKTETEWLLVLSYLKFCEFWEEQGNLSLVVRTASEKQTKKKLIKQELAPLRNIKF